MKAIIFDIDGTLLDSVDLHAEAWREALAKFGKDESFGRVGVLCGGFEEDVLRDAGASYLYANPSVLLEQYDESPLAKTNPSL